MNKLLDFLERDKAIMNIVRLALIFVILILIVIIIYKGATVGNLIFLVVVILALIFGYNLKGILNKGEKKDDK